MPLSTDNQCCTFSFLPLEISKKHSESGKITIFLNLCKVVGLLCSGNDF